MFKTEFIVYLTDLSSMCLPLDNKNGYSRNAIEIKHANMCYLVVQLYIYESNFSSQMMTAIFCHGDVGGKICIISFF